MLSALLMFRRVVKAFRVAVQEENFGPVFSAAVALVILGTLTYTLGQDWNAVDSLYFSVSTLTTTSVSDPDLALQDGWIKLFTVGYQLIGIGILVEMLRRMGTAFVTVQAEEKRAKPD
jgi:hypothetical protein